MSSVATTAIRKITYPRAVPPTKIRGVRVDDELWQAAQERAADRRESVADVIRRALLAYVEQT